MFLPGMENMRGEPKESPTDPELGRRVARRDANRNQRTHLIPTERLEGIRRDPVGDYGIQHRAPNLGHEKMAFSEFGPWDEKKYAAMGETKLYPRNAISTYQPSVSRDRVEQIRRDPKAAVGQRTPGFIQGIERDYGDVTITNGNHRASADLANGALFVPIRTVPVKNSIQKSMDYIGQKKGRQKRAQAKKAARAEKKAQT